MTAGVRQQRRDALCALPPAWSRLPTPLTVLVLVAGVAYRLGLLLADAPPTNSDEATMGLAALHITKGREFPVWFYGQRYMGTLEAYLAAPVFALAGPSTLALRLPTLALYAVFLLLAWRLTIRLTADRWFALLVVTVLALGADRVVKNQLIAGGGYPEMNAAGVALAVLAFDLATGRGRPEWRWAVWGLLAGLLLWVDPLVLPYVAATGLVLVAHRWRELPGRAGALLGLGVLLGAAPLLVESVASGRSPLDAVFAAAGSGQSAGWVDRLHGALVLGPALGMGFCFPGRCAGWQLWWSVVLPLLLLAAGLAARRVLRDGDPPTPTPGPVGPAPANAPAGVSATRVRAAVSLALVGAAVGTLAAYLASSASGRTPVESSRYLSCLLISVPVLLWPLWRAARRGWAAGGRRVLGAVAAGALAAVLGTAGVATAGAWGTMPAARAEQARHDDLVAALRERGVRHAYGGYWTCNRLTFASREDVICAVVDDELNPGHDRYRPYRTLVDSSPDAVWIAGSGSPLHERLSTDPDFRPLLTVPGWHAYRQGRGPC